jgi:hypothetical protein
MEHVIHRLSTLRLLYSGWFWKIWNLKETDHLLNLSIDHSPLLNRVRASLTGSGQGLVLGCSQHSNKPFQPISGRFFDQLGDYEILKKDSTSESTFITDSVIVKLLYTSPTVDEFCICEALGQKIHFVNKQSV